jgi:nitrite reductase/ring-hydroxylating ferredoxin subunit
MIDQADVRWYTVALSESVAAMRPVGVRCDEREYVLFRDAKGEINALADRCAHRRAALSLGVITASGQLQCAYHGWRYDGKSGICTSIPNLAAHERVPRTYRVPSFAVVEEAGWIHLWTGGPDPAYPPPQLTLAAGPREWRGDMLIAFPPDALADLLLDAPGAVLDIAGLTLFDLHRFGDPTLTPEYVEVTYAAAWKARTLSKKIIADFPHAVTIRLNHDGCLAYVELRTAAGETVSSLIVAISPAARAVSSVKWRGRGSDDEHDGARIDVRPVIDATAASQAVDYCSRLRTRIGTQTPKTSEGRSHERTNY